MVIIDRYILLVISTLMTLILDLTLEVLCAHIMQNHLMCVISRLVSTVSQFLSSWCVVSIFFCDFAS